MSIAIRKIQYLLGPLFMMFILSACAGDSVENWPRQTGQVFDETINKPIADAIVVARWKGTAEYSKTVCFHVESTTTDKKGRFNIPAWKNSTKWKYTENQHKTITVYKKGFQESKKTYKERTDSKGMYYQFPSMESRKDRFKYLRHINASCVNSGKSMRNLYPLYKARYEEGKLLARTREDKKVVNQFRRRAARVAVGGDEHISTEELENLINEFLMNNLP